MKPNHDFRSIKRSTFDAIMPPNAAPDRVGLVAAGNPDVLREAHGLEKYARKRKRGGRVKRLDAISGVHTQHRLDRSSRRVKKFDDGGAAIPYGGKSYVPYVPLDHSKTTIPLRPTPQQDLTRTILALNWRLGLAGLGGA